MNVPYLSVSTNSGNHANGAHVNTNHYLVTKDPDANDENNKSALVKHESSAYNSEGSESGSENRHPNPNYFHDISCNM